MKVSKGAILAVLLALGEIANCGPLPEPIKVRFKLADGVRVVGLMREWDKKGINGSFGRREWTEIKVDDVWKLYQKVMEKADAQQWVDLGAVLLVMPEGESKAEKAFDHAIRIDPASTDAIQTARDHAEEVKSKHLQELEDIKAQQLNTKSPETGPWSADLWPVLTLDLRINALNELKSEAKQIAQQSALQLKPIETAHFLIYSDIPRLSAAKWARMLERTYDEVSNLVGPFDSENIFWGKAVVYIFKDQDRFRLVEAETFKQLVPLKVKGLCHTVGPKVYISCYESSDKSQLARTLVRESVHGIMHRFRSAKRLPAWANQGYAEYIVSKVIEDPSLDDRLRRPALEFIRSGGNVATVVSLQYEDESFPGPYDIGNAIGYLLVDLMIRENPNGFRAWVHALKKGSEWPEALRDEFGSSLRTLVETFVQYYKVNN